MGVGVGVGGRAGWQLGRGRTNSPTASDLDGRCQDNSSLKRSDLLPPSLSSGPRNSVWIPQAPDLGQELRPLWEIAGGQMLSS